MIISLTHRFAFVHIPKCAGMSVRHQLRKIDGETIALGDPGDHPVLGRIDYGHIQLSVLREHFPEYYGYVRDFESYAIARDPLERFGSALRQTLWAYDKRPMTTIPPGELRELTLRTLDEVAGQIDRPSFKFIFFARQTDFVYDGAERVVRHVYPVEAVDAFIREIGARTGTTLDDAGRSNQNVDLRVKSLARLAYAVNDRLYRTLPRDVHARIKALGLRLLARKGSAAESSGILDLPEVRAFVAEAYAGDRELHRRALVEHGRDAAALKSA